MLSKLYTAIGFICAILISSTVFFGALTLTKRLPQWAHYWHVALMVGALAVAGFVVKRSISLDYGHRPHENPLLSGAKEFGLALTTLINSVLLSFAYVVGIGLSVVVARMAGKRLLEIGIDKKSKTYWTDLSLETKPIHDHLRQF